MQQIFNTSPDATLITRFEEGLFIDVNEGFSSMTGYTHDEVIWKYILNTNLWNDKADRKIFLNALDEKWICENMVFVFQRKDGGQFVAVRILIIYELDHIIGSVHDINQRKQVEVALMESEE